MVTPAESKGPTAAFAIAEIDDGLTVVEVQAGETAEEAAVRSRGVLVDPGPYVTYRDAYDALMELDTGEDDEDEDQSA